MIGRLSRAAGRFEVFDPSNVARLSGRGPREFPAGYRYEPAPRVPLTRQEAATELRKLAAGADAARLLERVAAHEDAEMLRAVLVEVGVRQVAGEAGAAGASPRRRARRRLGGAGPVGVSPPQARPGSSARPPPPHGGSLCRAEGRVAQNARACLRAPPEPQPTVSTPSLGRQDAPPGSPAPGQGAAATHPIAYR